MAIEKKAAEGRPGARRERKKGGAINGRMCAQGLVNAGLFENPPTGVSSGPFIIAPKATDDQWRSSALLPRNLRSKVVGMNGSNNGGRATSGNGPKH